MNIAVVGIGRVGLPLAATMAGRGHMVFGCDVDSGLVAGVNQGQNPFPDEAGLGEAVRAGVEAGHLKATTETAEAVRQCQAILFAVAVAVDEAGRADLGGLLSACRDVAQGLQPGALCIFDTTLPVGSTRRELAPALESKGMTLGRDFSVAYSPERLLMGRVLADLAAYPKIVGGVDAEGGRRAAEFYRAVLGVEVIEMDAESAELAKIAEGVYRDLNIALANELAQVADTHGIDICEVISAANSQPHCHIHLPGAGVGGHCIPVYPRVLIQGEGPSALPELGRRINDSMPAYAVGRLEAAAGSLAGKRVVILGLTFRAGVAVTHHTNAVDLKRELEARGARVWGHDPLLGSVRIAGLGFEEATSLAGYDAAILHSNHAAYRDLDWRSLAPVVLDARNALDRRPLEAKGVRYVGVGRPATGG